MRLRQSHVLWRLMGAGFTLYFRSPWYIMPRILRNLTWLNASRLGFGWSLYGLGYLPIWMTYIFYLTSNFGYPFWDVYYMVIVWRCDCLYNYLSLVYACSQLHISRNILATYPSNPCKHGHIAVPNTLFQSLPFLFCALFLSLDIPRVKPCRHIYPENLWYEFILF